MNLKHWNEWNEEDRRAVKEGWLTFYDPDADVALNSIPLEEGVCVPRMGERVWLPGENRQTSDSYEVAEVRYLYGEVKPRELAGHARQIGVQIRVRRFS